MTSQKRAFENRVGKLKNQHAALRKGKAVGVPKNRIGTSSHPNMGLGLPITSLVLIVVAFVLFKAYAFAQMGPQDYEARLEDMRSDNMLGQAGAFLFQADYVTEALSTFFVPSAPAPAEPALQEPPIELAENDGLENDGPENSIPEDDSPAEEIEAEE